MEKETPNPSPQNPDTEDDIFKFDPMPFRWNPMVAPPWDPGTYYFFLMPDNLFYEAVPIGFTLDLAKNFHTAMANFCSAASYAGMHKSIERIGNDMVLQGKDPGEATLLATIAVQLIHQGIANFLPDFTHVYLNVLADQGKSLAFIYPASPMHLWAFVQACDLLEKDILPLFEFKDGGDSYPFGEIADIKKALQFTRDIFAAEIAELMEGLNPYKQISDLRAVGEMVSKQPPPS